MCVIAVAWQQHSRWPLLLVGNRDEAHARGSAALARWRDAPGVLAGRDLLAGGTWMGVTDSGRVAVVTNVRAPAAAPARVSRGLLVSEFLRGRHSATAHARQLLDAGSSYRPFNLLLFDLATAWFVSNWPQSRVRAIEPGVHGLSNGDLDGDWPKVCQARAALAAWLRAGDEDWAPLWNAFHAQTPAPDSALPDTGVGLELERALSPLFVRGSQYGTRASTLIAVGPAAGCIIERRFGADAVPAGATKLEFAVAAPRA